MRKVITLNYLTKLSACLWLLCVTAVGVIMGYVVGYKNQTFDVGNETLALVMAGFILLGGFFFLLGCLSYTIMSLKKNQGQKPFFIVFWIKILFTMAILPIYAGFQVVRPRTIWEKVRQDGWRGVWRRLYPKLVLKKIACLGFIGLILLPIWIVGYLMVGYMTFSLLGYSPEPMNVTGTGSMAPTFPRGEGSDRKELSKQIVGTPGMIPYPNGLFFQGKRYFGYQIGRGDIVVIENEIIREMTKKMYDEPSGWIKRIVGMPGETIEIRGGIVYVNNEPLKEPYTLRPRSTFGESFLSECRQITIPDDSIFVMGDNRKGSGDSREVGFIKIDEINHVMPLKDQIGLLDKDWRNTDNDLEDSAKTKLDKEKYLELLNEKRIETGAKPLKYQEKLELSAQKRGEIILEYDDYSFEATRSGYTMLKAMREANYSNITYGEAPNFGYYTETELIENQFEFPNSRNFLSDKNYQEVGIAEVEGEINGCPTQVIVQHFAGYVPPNYKKEDIESWRNVENDLRKIQPSWENLVNNVNFYQQNRADIDRLNRIIATRIANNSAIAKRMEANQWLTTLEKKMAEEDKSLYDEMEALAIKLNNL